MILNKNLLFPLIFLLFSLKLGNGDRTKDKMYEAVDGSKACFRRLNATHQIGCTSKRGGSTGAIHFCESQSDLDFILRNGTAGPYVPVLPIGLFTAQNVNKCKKSNKVSGMLLYVTKERPMDFTHDNQCPNRETGLKNSCGRDKPIWNPRGSGLLFEDIPFPVFYVENEGDVIGTKECFKKHNNFSFDTQRDRSLCSLQLVSFMYATKDSPTCIRRSNLVTNLNPVKFCDPLGDQNVWASLFPLVRGKNLTEPVSNDTEHIIVAARLDTTSMFEKTAGAASPVTGLVTLLATAKLLKTMLPAPVENAAKSQQKNVLFVLFNGESYDYIGSQRFLYDMSKGLFPASKVVPSIRPDDISLFVELSQLSRNGGAKVYAHHLGSQSPAFLAKLEGNKAAGLDLTASPDTVPPASLQTFLKNRTDLPGLVLADHGGAYLNHYYNSIFDNATNVGFTYYNVTAEDADSIPKDSVQNFVGEVASMVAGALYEEITGEKYRGDAKADLQFVDELFHCYLENSTCRVHQAVQKLKVKSEPFSLYIGVDSVSNFITNMAGLTLGWVTGDDVGEGNRNCTNEPKNYALKYFNMSDSLDDLNMIRCFRITMNFTDAISPAFIIKDYDWSSGQYSSWTESTWGDIKIRLFLKPSSAHENMTIAIGSIVFIISSLFVYFIKSRSDILFAPSLPTLAPTDC